MNPRNRPYWLLFSIILFIRCVSFASSPKSIAELRAKDLEIENRYIVLQNEINGNQDWFKDDELAKKAASFFADRDLFNRNVLDYFVSEIARATAEIEGDSKIVRTKEYQKIRRALQKYEVLAGQKMGSISPELVLAGNSIFGLAKILGIGPEFGSGDSRPNFFRKIWFGLHLSSSLAQIATSTLTEGHSSNKQFQASGRIKKTLSNLGKSLNISIEVENPELLSADPNVVRIYAPTHANMILDHLIMGQIMPPNTSILAAVPPSLPSFLLNAVDASSTFINTKSDRIKAINKIESMIFNNEAKSFWLYPEGSHSSGVLESRPVNPGFARALVRRLVASGVKLEIVPIAFPDNYLPFAEGLPAHVIADRLSKISKLRAIVGQPISYQTIQELASNGRLEKIDLLLRVFWENFVPKANFSSLIKDLGATHQCRSFYGLH